MSHISTQKRMALCDFVTHINELAVSLEKQKGRNMKEEHEKLIEHIVSKFKEDPNGKMHKQVFAIFIEDAELRELISNILVKDLKFIDDIDSQLYRINLNGYSFTSFQDIRDKELAKELMEKIEYEKSLIDLELSKKILKEYPYTKWAARIGLFIAFALALKELYILLKK